MNLTWAQYWGELRHFYREIQQKEAKYLQLDRSEMVQQILAEFNKYEVQRPQIERRAERFNRPR